MSSSFASLSLTQLRTLDVLLELRNLSHAALRLDSSQSVLSRQLANLREAFGDPLLVRQGREFVLTEQAQALVTPLKQVIVDLEALSSPDRFRPENCSRTFSLAASDYVAEYILPLLMERLDEVAPKVAVDYVTWQPRRFDLLAGGGLDLATTMLDDAPPEFHGRILGEDRPVCVMRRFHPLSGKTLEGNDYLAWKHVSISGGGDKDSFIDRYLQQGGHSRDVRLYVPFYAAAMRVVSNSDMLVTLPEHIAVQMSELYPVEWSTLPFIEQRHRYWVIWHQRTQHAPAHRWFRNLVYEVWQESNFGISRFTSKSNAEH
ncbi:LysR family transcriptional regulator [Pseudomonas chlororaphis]|uniref:LysR family transcriptional regulator n=1 Tax=Pseudomonas chlororaphis TaxID=587753 RepID=A0AAX3FUA2_9PSED|nr:LysR family transcriptional regulator [Pseudomonas chlororaphis]AZC39845.1 Transcriptional regulator, LysR family [Pseudomonas chlororaphis subsp. piscium]AZC46402.1 Transcriptional regulator, LysR family [Pseudomonas chlororaphis subsp. piscium]AZC59392.1 Transcriptional regulator, LysR family [Pseudomonas chlororaphis subsp. piscium]WDG71908.1 LysR family transcriptional regulator [Pseudomonas chlororaphis]WDH30308.1 LysR family transcriptional regulator [Pseudomonas chlororaphis]